MRKRYAFFITGLLAVFLLLFCLFISSVNVLSISARKTPSNRYYHKIGNCECFVISYTHSVNKGRVHDFYTWDKSGVLTMAQTEFVSYGAGIPEPEETPGAFFEVSYQGYFIKNINRKVEKLTMGVGIIANHTLRFDSTAGIGEEIPFTRLFQPQTSVILEIKKVSVIDYLLHRF